MSVHQTLARMKPHVWMELAATTASVTLVFTEKIARKTLMIVSMQNARITRPVLIRSMDFNVFARKDSLVKTAN